MKNKSVRIILLTPNQLDQTRKHDLKKIMLVIRAFPGQKSESFWLGGDALKKNFEPLLELSQAVRLPLSLNAKQMPLQKMK